MPNRPLAPEDLAQVLHQAQDSFTALRNAHIFITGGTGFFGHWLLETLLHANSELDLNLRVTVLTRNAAGFAAKSPHITRNRAITLLESDMRSFAFPAEQVTHIVHAATDSGGQQANLLTGQMEDAVLGGTRRVLELALQHGAVRLLYTSTGAVYGRSTSLPCTPETYTAAPDRTSLQAGYDHAKLMAEQLCLEHAQDSALEPVIARCFAFVGPHLPLGQHFAIGNFLRSAMLGERIHITGDGTPLRSWLYMADLAAWLWTLLVKGKAKRAYNVGSDEVYSIAEAAQLTATTLRPDGHGCSSLPVLIDGTPDPSAPRNSYVPCIDRARGELDLRVTIPLKEALRRTAAWHGFTANSG